MKELHFKKCFQTKIEVEKSLNVLDFVQNFGLFSPTRQGICVDQFYLIFPFVQNFAQIKFLMLLKNDGQPQELNLATRQIRKLENLRILLHFGQPLKPTSKYGDFKKKVKKSARIPKKS